MGSRVELFEQIRRAREIEGASIRNLAVGYNVHRRTVHQTLVTAAARPRRFYLHPQVRFNNTSVLTDPELMAREGWLCWIVRPVEEGETDFGRGPDVPHHVQRRLQPPRIR